mmetsp:Transcript_11902/g.30136  ORF Transcript_11902/g.30136 Transcript_11902/m.30136 type:complete len:224 (-) Transcript_11902:470-1141(-)
MKRLPKTFLIFCYERALTLLFFDWVAPVSVVRLGVIERRGHRRNDGKRVELGVGGEVVRPDVEEVDRARDFRHLEKVLDIVEHVRIFSDALLTALEVDHIDGVEANQSHEEPDVDAGHSVAAEIPRLRQQRLHSIQGRVELLDRLVVGPLRLGKARFVHPVVNVMVDPLLQLCRLLLQRVGVQVQARILRHGVEAAVQHAADLARLVVHDRPLLAVPQDRRGE